MQERSEQALAKVLERLLEDSPTPPLDLARAVLAMMRMDGWRVVPLGDMTVSPDHIDWLVEHAYAAGRGTALEDVEKKTMKGNRPVGVGAKMERERLMAVIKEMNS